MSACSCCHRDEAEVKPRRGLRTIDFDGNRTINPFDGPLCGECFTRTQRFGSPEHRWLLKQVGGYDSLAFAGRAANQPGLTGK
jgi:hypothetical protein